MDNSWYLMSGYALYVWSSYGIVLTCLFIAVIRSKYRRRMTLLQLKQWFKEVR